jgi:hypothetical protein
LNQLVDLREIQQEGTAIEGDLDRTVFNPVSSTIQKWMAFKLLRWMLVQQLCFDALLNHSNHVANVTMETKYVVYRSY